MNWRSVLVRLDWLERRPPEESNDVPPELWGLIDGSLDPAGLDEATRDRIGELLTPDPNRLDNHPAMKVIREQLARLGLPDPGYAHYDDNDLCIVEEALRLMEMPTPANEPRPLPCGFRELLSSANGVTNGRPTNGPSEAGESLE